MARILRTELARRDLIALWVWFAENGGATLADRFLDALDSTLQTLGAHPEIGPLVFASHPELQGLRRFRVSPPFTNLLLFYRLLPDGMELIRVLHGSRDLDQLWSDFPLDHDPLA
jgi:toxin ParE1/3/4